MVEDSFWPEWRRMLLAGEAIVAAALDAAPLLRGPCSAGPPGVAGPRVGVEDFCAGVEERLARAAAGPPGAGEPPEDGALRRKLHAIAGRMRSPDAPADDRDDVLHTAVLLWRSMVSGRSLRPEARSDGGGRPPPDPTFESLPERLAERADKLRSAGWEKVLRTALRDCMLEAELDGAFTTHRKRQWAGVQRISLEVRPEGGLFDVARCDPAHFDAVLHRILDRHKADKNLPKTGDGVLVVFALFCACCRRGVPLADPDGIGERETPSVEFEDPIEIEEEEGQEPLPELPDSVDESVQRWLSGIKRKVRRWPADDQLVLAWIAKAPELATAAARAECPDAEKVLRARSAGPLRAALALGEEEFRGVEERVEGHLARWAAELQDNRQKPPEEEA